MEIHRDLEIRMEGHPQVLKFFVAISLPSVPVVKNGLVLELFALLKSNKSTWATFSSWIENLHSGGTKPNTWALRKSVIAVSTN